MGRSKNWTPVDLLALFRAGLEVTEGPKAKEAELHEKIAEYYAKRCGDAGVAVRQTSGKGLWDQFIAGHLLSDKTKSVL